VNVTNAKGKETMFPKIEEINWHVIKMFGAAVSEKLACCARILARVWLTRAELKRRAEHGVCGRRHMHFSLRMQNGGACKQPSVRPVIL
jgi:hypothetical protein